MKKTKNLWAVAALVMGMGLGLGMAFSPTAAEASDNNLATNCVRDSDCKTACGANAGVCINLVCYCTM